MKTQILGEEDRNSDFNPIEPKEIESWIELIETLIEEKKYQKAEDAIRMALCLDYKCEKLWIELGNLLSISNQIDEATECYEQVLKLNPRNRLAKDKLASMNFDINKS